jgi:hypothetical protein
LRITYLYFLSIVFLGFGCSDDAKLEGEFQSVLKQIEITLSQNVTTEGPHLEFLISTIDSLNCKNATLNVSTNEGSNIYEISINGLSLIGECEKGNGKPIVTKGLKSNRQWYNLAFDLKGAVRSEGLLKIEFDNYSISMEEEVGIKINNYKINKINPATVWGVLYGATPADKEAFQTIIKEHVYTSYFKMGNYGLFDVQADNSYFVKSISLKPISDQLHFVYQYKDWDTFKNVVTEFAKQKKLKLKAKDANDKDISI